jgi:hypothetical protein
MTGEEARFGDPAPEAVVLFLSRLDEFTKSARLAYLFLGTTLLDVGGALLFFTASGADGSLECPRTLFANALLKVRSMAIAAGLGFSTFRRLVVVVMVFPEIPRPTLESMMASAGLFAFVAPFGRLEVLLGSSKSESTA